MIEEAQNTLLEAIDKIFQKGHKSRYSDSFQRAVLKETEIIKKYLGITEARQANLWAISFGMCVQCNSSIELDMLSNYLDSTILRVFTYGKDFDDLVQKKLLVRQRSARRKRCGESLTNQSFAIPTDVIYSVISNEPLPKRRQSNLSMWEILDEVYTLFEKLDSGYLDDEEFSIEIQRLVSENSTNSTIRTILNYKLSPLETSILLVVMQQFSSGNHYLAWLGLLRSLERESRIQIKVRKEWMSGKSKLQTSGLIRFEEDSQFRNDTSITLTDKGIELFGDDRSLIVELDVPKSKDIILSTSIVEQKLFFNEREKGELDFLSNLLQPNNYNEVVNRLKSNHMKVNFTILFSGQAGTGKTESVYQIARSTGRDIKMVDISKTKSKWFGESEKLIMGVFSSYKKLVASSKLTPILLFNAPDGVLGSRQTGEESSVRQTENAIQTCLLQSLEDFEGILIATTNLPLSIKEFERRFLYKIAFDKPDPNTRSNILRDKMPFLSDDQIYRISESYSLTGGQVANLSKKVILQQILTGKYPDMDEILRLCESEFLVKSSGRNPIGFKVCSVGKNNHNNQYS